MLSVIQSCNNWLSTTQTWLFTQVDNLPDNIQNHIVCHNTINLDQFPQKNILCFSDQVSGIDWLLQKGIRKIRKKLGISTHLAFTVKKAIQIKPDIIHSHFGDRGWMDISAVRKSGACQVVTFYGYDVSKLSKDQQWRKRFKKLFSQAHLFLCEGPHMANCLSMMGCPSEKIQVHHLGIELPKFPFKPRVWAQDQPLKILIAGTFTEKKGIPYAINALGYLAEKFDMELTILGDAKSSESSKSEKKKILSSLNQTGLLKKTFLPGYVCHKTMTDAYYKHHIMISPSVTAASGDTEGGAPISILEAAASGMPVISTEHCDIPNILRYSRGGMLARERDSKGLADILNRWLQSPGFWQTDLMHARKHVETEFDAQIQGRRLGEIYEKLIRHV